MFRKWTSTYRDEKSTIKRCWWKGVPVIFTGLERDHGDLLAAVRAQFPSEAPRVSAEPVVIHFPDAVAMLRAAGADRRASSTPAATT